jgi:hypothetical protein
LNENNNDGNWLFEIEEVNVEIRFWIILGGKRNAGKER